MSNPVMVRAKNNREYPPRMVPAKHYKTLSTARRRVAQLSARDPRGEYWVAIGPDGLFYVLARHVWNTGELAETFSILPQSWCK